MEKKNTDKPAFWTDTTRFKVGFLVKQGDKVKNWKRRFFVLDRISKTLQYFVDPNDKKPKGCVVVERRIISDADHITNKSFSFMIQKAGQRTYYILAGDEESKKSWMTELTLASRTSADLTKVSFDSCLERTSFSFNEYTPGLGEEITIVGKDPDSTLVHGKCDQIFTVYNDASKAPVLSLFGLPPHTKVIDTYVSRPIALGRRRDDNDDCEPNFIPFMSNVVSRRHAEIYFSKEQFYIRDLGSQGGTFLNSVRLSPERQESQGFQIQNGDVIQLGVDLYTGVEPWVMAVRLSVEIHSGLKECSVLERE